MKRRASRRKASSTTPTTSSKNNKPKEEQKINTRCQEVTYGKKLLHGNMINGRIVACTFDCQLSNVYVCLMSLMNETRICSSHIGIESNHLRNTHTHTVTHTPVSNFFYPVSIILLSSCVCVHNVWPHSNACCLHRACVFPSGLQPHFSFFSSTTHTIVRNW